MGQGGLYVLVLLGLLVAASERNKDDVTRCWTKGREVNLRPHQCPAEFDGAGAKFCCRLCYGANCCQPRRPWVNQDRCPPAAQLFGTIRDRRALPDAKTTTDRKKEVYQYYIDFVSVVLILPALFILAGLFIALYYCSACCRKWWDSGLAEQIAEVQPLRGPARRLVRSNVYPNLPCLPLALRVDAPPPYSLVDPEGTQDSPPPYPGPPEADPQGIGDLPPPYPGPPVVVFQRAGSQAQEDSVVVLPLQVTLPKAAASGGAPGAAVTGRAPDKVGLLEAAASGGAPGVMVLQEAAVPGGAPGAAVAGGAPEGIDPLEAAVFGGAPELP